MNLTTLAESLDDSETSVDINNDIFQAADTITCGEEDMTVSVRGTTMTVVRGAGSTDAAAHGNNQPIYKSTGTEVLTHTFDGSTEYLNAVRISAETDIMFRITWYDDSETTSYYYTGFLTPYQQEAFFPMARYLPAQDDIITITAWSPVEYATVYAELQS